MKIFETYSAATVLAVSLSLAAATGASAATRHHPGARADSGNVSHARRYYNYAPIAPGLGIGTRFNGAPSQSGPPDPASCGGFRC